MNKKLIIPLIAVVILIGASVVFWSRPPAYEPETIPAANNQPSEPVAPVEAPPVAAKPIPAGAIVSPDKKYYITDTKKPFPSIVDVATGKTYVFKPGDHYSRVSNLKWSPDGQYLAYLYRVSGTDYSGVDILNTIPTAEAILSGNFSQARRVLSTGAEMDYEWMDKRRLLYYQLLQKQPAGYYENASVNIYNVATEQFATPLKDLTNGPYIPYVYSLEFSPDLTRMLYRRAVLDDNKKVIRREYVEATLDGTELGTTAAYDEEWYR